MGAWAAVEEFHHARESALVRVEDGVEAGELLVGIGVVFVFVVVVVCLVAIGKGAGLGVRLIVGVEGPAVQRAKEAECICFAVVGFLGFVAAGNMFRASIRVCGSVVGGQSFGGSGKPEVEPRDLDVLR